MHDMTAMIIPGMLCREINLLSIRACSSSIWNKVSNSLQPLPLRCMTIIATRQPGLISGLLIPSGRLHPSWKPDVLPTSDQIGAEPTCLSSCCRSTSIRNTWWWCSACQTLPWTSSHLSLERAREGSEWSSQTLSLDGHGILSWCQWSRLQGHYQMGYSRICSWQQTLCDTKGNCSAVIPSQPKFHVDWLHTDQLDEESGYNIAFEQFQNTYWLRVWKHSVRDQSILTLM